MKHDILYMKIEPSMCVKESVVTIDDIAAVYCANSELEKQIRKQVVMEFPKEQMGQQVVSVLKIVEMLKEKFENLEVANLGEADFVVYYKPADKKNRKWMEKLKILFVCLIAFLGAGYSIMAYNTDVSATELFNQLHTLFTGKEPEGPSIIMLAYSVGLLIGVIVFFNHGMYRKVATDPTPLQVQMRLYEQDVNDAIIIDADRKQETLDVD